MAPYRYPQALPLTKANARFVINMRDQRTRHREPRVVANVPPKLVSGDVMLQD